MKKYLVLLLVSCYLLLAPQAYAEQLDTCQERNYCENNKLIQKRSCRLAPQFSNLTSDDLKERSGEKLCICQYSQLAGTCDTEGGIPREQTPLDKVFGQVEPPPAIKALGFGAEGISRFLTNLLLIIYLIAATIFTFMLVWGALQYITSGGDKEAVGNARRRIVYAIIGIVILALAGLFTNIFGQITGFEFFSR